MAIQFARCEYVSRSSGGNACRKAAYNQREAMTCERTGQLFSFKAHSENVHHEILLPEGVSGLFKSSSALWNEAERCEKRKNSQVAKEFVLALPDDKVVSLEDRIELARRFAGEHFVEKGLGVQIDIHAPHHNEKNWHAHLLVTTRRFKDSGQSLGEKARDLDPVVRKGMVVEADLWGEIWRNVQNDYFKEKGYDLRVDPLGLIPQEHMGPVRMRHHLNEAQERSKLLKQANEQLAHNPDHVLDGLTQNQAVFTTRDVDRFLAKFGFDNIEERNTLREQVLKHPTLTPLYDKETGEKTGYFTTTHVRNEEEKLIRLADAIVSRETYPLRQRSYEAGLSGKTLTDEQKVAYDQCVNSNENLVIIQGRAGVGKSYVLGAIREAHEADGYRVIGLGPTHKVALALQESGFAQAKTCHGFLFALKNNRERVDGKTLVIVDEAGMLGSPVSLELFHALKKAGAKLILVGDDRQLGAVDRPGPFAYLAERYGSVELKDVRRQFTPWQKELSEDLSQGLFKSAVALLEAHQALHWTETREKALSTLLNQWNQDSVLYPRENRLILAQRNVDVDALNAGARDLLRARGNLGTREITCMTSRGETAFAVGDRVHVTESLKDQGITNGQFGHVVHIDARTKTLTLQLDGEDTTKEIDPRTYRGLRHGYAVTVYKAQGSTLDRAYVLHTKTSSRSLNYVALTRQTRALTLSVSKEETPDQHTLIRQMGRDDGKQMSLCFDTQRNIGRQIQNQDNSLKAILKEGFEAVATKVKDLFHTNPSFYHFEKESRPNHPVSVGRAASFKAFVLKESKAQEGFFTGEKFAPTKDVTDAPKVAGSFKNFQQARDEKNRETERDTKDNFFPNSQRAHEAENSPDIATLVASAKGATSPIPADFRYPAEHDPDHAHNSEKELDHEHDHGRGR